MVKAGRPRWPKSAMSEMSENAANQSNDRLVSVELDERLAGQLSDETAHERDVAIYALLEDNHFSLIGSARDGAAAAADTPLSGPYRLSLSVAADRLALAIRGAASDDTYTILLPVSLFRRIFRDYRLVCDSYYDAIKTSAPARIEAIDMGRRGLHDEGSRILIDALEGKVKLDFETARRLFTLFYALQWQGGPTAKLS